MSYDPRLSVRRSNLYRYAHVHKDDLATHCRLDNTDMDSEQELAWLSRSGPDTKATAVAGMSEWYAGHAGHAGHRWLTPRLHTTLGLGPHGGVL